MYDRATWRRISSNIDPHKSMNKMKRKKHSGRFPITEAVSVIRSPASSTRNELLLLRYTT